MERCVVSCLRAPSRAQVDDVGVAAGGDQVQRRGRRQVAGVAAQTAKHQAQQRRGLPQEIIRSGTCQVLCRRRSRRRTVQATPPDRCVRGTGSAWTSITNAAGRLEPPAPSLTPGRRTALITQVTMLAGRDWTMGVSGATAATGCRTCSIVRKPSRWSRARPPTAYSSKRRLTHAL